MKIYVAHNFAARLWLREALKPLVDFGHEITSRWIYDDSHVHESTASANALVDIQDIERADLLIIIVDKFDPAPGASTGKGKWFEWGYALGIGKTVYVVGADNSCVFWHHVHSKHFRFYNLDSAIGSLVDAQR